MIKIAKSDEEYIQCFEILKQLRPHICLEDFLVRVNRMSREIGYSVVYLVDGDIKVVAGIRLSEWLHTGKYIEIEELITKKGERSKGYGSELFDWLLKHARDKGCKQVRLVSGVSREAAHKFYMDKGMAYEAKYFSIDVQ